VFVPLKNGVFSVLRMPQTFAKTMFLQSVYPIKQDICYGK